MAGPSSIGIQVTGYKGIKKALQILGETDAPFLREAMEKVGHLAERETRARAPGTMASKTDFIRVALSRRGDIRALLAVKHGGAIPMEFGRTRYYRQYKRGAKGEHYMKATGYKGTYPGQRAKPFVGVVNQDHAIGAVKDDMARLLGEALEKEWERITRGTPD